LQLVSSLNIDTLLSKLNLHTHKHTLAKYLSAGQQRRLALAKLFLIKKILWLLDEPLTALDVGTQAFFLSQLTAHLHDGGMCVLSSHQPITLPEHTCQVLRMITC